MLRLRCSCSVIMLQLRSGGVLLARCGMMSKLAYTCAVCVCPYTLCMLFVKGKGMRGLYTPFATIHIVYAVCQGEGNARFVHSLCNRVFVKGKGMLGCVTGFCKATKYGGPALAGKRGGEISWKIANLRPSN